jgi:hypothetical protein
MTYAPFDQSRREDTESTVLIASEDVLANWSASAATPTDLLALADADALHALAVIERRRPRIVVLEHRFAASLRGATLVNLLGANSDLAGLDIRVLPAARSAMLGSSGPIAGRALAAMATSLQQTPTRRARRITLPPGAEMRVNGSNAALINVSTFGVQVLSPSALKPNQKVEVVIDRYGVDLRTRAQIAWAAVELAPAGMLYRAGVAFADAQPELLKFDSVGVGVP